MFIDRSYKIVVIGGSAGSFQGITKILSNLPENFDIPIVLCMHRLKHVRHGFVEALENKSNNPVLEPYDKQSIRKGNIYLAPANYHLSFDFGYSFAMSTEEMVNNSRPSIDITFDGASYIYKKDLIGILLSGANKDGAKGMKKIKDRGGLTIVQNPEDCFIDTMTSAAMEETNIDHVLNLDQIVTFLQKLGETKSRL